MTDHAHPLPTDPYAPVPRVDRTSSLAIAGFVLAFVANVVGLVVSIVALVRIHRTGEHGRGLAIAGIAVGGAWIALFAVALLAHALVVTVGH
ncbi:MULTISPECIES: DUF4190 domain-containing protein [unclassified Curtobacterium]|uniref:DUF4190 domain-containing protein n=1 Tax=unclassified Curtobacterium TaxID=257496 RepID=UPI0008DDF1AB|nr:MULTISPECIES: DUF4190 domain-containing protein [unclassified Curtobacterium]WIA97117.1 DUF4190 domain-containing protein [Curtobacterium sp. MCBA15_004]WIB00445.1 DUF4190 domain-containing protein [Curtobacterium sp. MCBA15_012]